MITKKTILYFIILSIISVIFLTILYGFLLLNILAGTFFSFIISFLVIPTFKQVKEKMLRTRDINEFLHNLWINQKLYSHEENIIIKSSEHLENKKLKKSIENILLNKNLDNAEKIKQFTIFSKYTYVANFLNLFYITLEQGKNHEEYKNNRKKLITIKREGFNYENNLFNFFTIKRNILKQSIIIGVSIIIIGGIAYKFTTLFNHIEGLMYYHISIVIYLLVQIIVAYLAKEENLYETLQ